MIRVLLIISLILSWLALPWATSPAYACSCAGPDPSRNVGWADVVLVGRIQSLDWPEPRFQIFPLPGYVTSSRDPVWAYVQVERYLKGSGGNVQTFHSPVQGPSCGFLDPQDTGRRYVLFLKASPDGYSSSLCSGNAALDQSSGQARLADVEAITGPGTLPLSPPTSSADENTGLPWMPVTAGGVAVAALAASGAFYLLRLRPRKPTE